MNKRQPHGDGGACKSYKRPGGELGVDRGWTDMLSAHDVWHMFRDLKCHLPNRKHGGAAHVELVQDCIGKHI